MLIMVLIFVSGISNAAEKKIKSTSKTEKKAVEAASVPAGSSISQGDFARKLVKVFGWEEGLPKDPTDRDYLRILSGKRTLKFEAEAIYEPKTDPVASRNFDRYGPFSGDAWLGGTASPATVHFTVFIPLAGEYRLSASAKGDGQVWKISGREYTANSGGSLSLTKVATVPLKAGKLEFEMVLPPEGGIDYVIFEAGNLSPVEPLDGWRFTASLTLGSLAEISVALLGWEDQLPIDEATGRTTLLASDLKEIPQGAKLTDAAIFGPITGKNWVRAGSLKGELDFPFTVSRPGVYGLKLRYMGNSLSAILDGTELVRDGKRSLDWIDLGLYRFTDGPHSLRIRIQPYEGVDALVIEPRHSTPAAYMAVAGLKGDPASPVTPQEVENVLSRLVERFKTRK